MEKKENQFSRVWIGVFVLMFCCLLWIPSKTLAASSIKLTAKREQTSCILKWSKQRGVKGYRIYQYDSKGKLLKTINTNKTTYIFLNLKTDKSYQFRVKSYKIQKSKVKFISTSNKIKVKAVKSSIQKEKTTGKKNEGKIRKVRTKVSVSKSKNTRQTKSTLKKLLQTALKPVGSTMYVWGGGWNKADTGAGKTATTIGLNPKWKKFFKKQTSSYDYTKTKFQIENGLDCSGYIGWSIYNILHTKSGNSGYVMKAADMAKNFASRGWGTYTYKTGVRDYRAGDIMSMPGHVWMVLGQCKDGSVVLLHSSPPGVQISGTATRSGRKNSQAVALAKKYMKKYYPKWYKKYPESARGSSYLTQSSRMRWDLSGNSIMSDPDGYRKMSAEQILQDLF